MPHLPTLIFCDENSVNPYLTDLLIKLQPKLLEIGYTHFFHESPNDKNAQDMIKQMETTSLEYAKYWERFLVYYEELQLLLRKTPALDFKELLKKVMKDTERSEGTDNFQAIFTVAVCFVNILQTTNEQQRTHFDILATLAKLKKALTEPAAVYAGTKFFLQQLIDTKTTYQAIDDPAISTFMLPGSYSVKSMREMEKHTKMFLSLPFARLDNIEYRDILFANAYLSSDQPAYSAVALAHLPGLQKQLVEKLTLPTASERFCFIYPYTIPAENDLLPIRQKIRAAASELPLGVTLINAIDKDVDAVVEQVLAGIRAKIELMNAQEKMVQVPDSAEVQPKLQEAKVAGKRSTLFSAENSNAEEEPAKKQLKIA